MKRKPLQIDVVTLFPAFFKSPLQESIVKIAQHKKFVTITIHNLRDYTHDLHRTCDDKPFGGGPGMVMKPEPIFDCIEHIKKKHPRRRIVYLTPQGKPLRQKTLEKLSRLRGFILLCGHYEGVDQRVRDHLVDDEISIGDFVLTGGEIPALCLIDGVIRLIPGVLGNKESLKHESFQDGLLDYPHYTRPYTYRRYTVPAVLRSGNHTSIAQWRTKQALERTKRKRKDILIEHRRKKGKDV